MPDVTLKKFNDREHQTCLTHELKGSWKLRNLPVQYLVSEVKSDEMRMRSCVQHKVCQRVSFLLHRCTLIGPRHNKSLIELSFLDHQWFPSYYMARSTVCLSM